MLSLQMVLYGYSLLLLMFLLLDSKAVRGLYSKKAVLFRWIIRVTMQILVIEAITFAVDRVPGKAMYWAAHLSNSLLFLMTLAPLSLWLVYLDECIVTDERMKKRKRAVYAVFNLIAAGIVVANLFTGILFTIQLGNVYMRGPAVVWIMALNGILFFGYLPTLWNYRTFISGRIYELILALGVLPFLGAAIQILFYGTPALWPMMALVALAAHFLVEKEEIRRDCLTGLCSRMQMEARAQYLIDHCQPFSMILLDIDQFKNINDTYGHEEGDRALCVIANLLNKSIKQIDSAYRYAGDEFILIIESDKPEAADRVVERLKSNLGKYNHASHLPYVLSFSCGIVFNNASTTASVVCLFSEADRLMYANKKLHYGETETE
jgi:diguanylate cyclase (GGDEF)-like protein